MDMKKVVKRAVSALEVAVSEGYQSASNKLPGLK
ncbi:MAG: hypothetical protein ACI9GH_000670 [Candidatus Paceibacteria bacterium]